LTKAYGRYIKLANKWFVIININQIMGAGLLRGLKQPK